ncbi:protein SPIRAL1-like 3 [Vigna radiata var. radiata]|uniref:Protein SPIRAL1-like 3 n=1 Tax=Vigna radiata var. radiata TaxID=3916 RepID=A0A3Q0EMI6_VIGRR|nr:protein SPIRAL1-like 3 [Vigna radiata var. radiata]
MGRGVSAGSGQGSLGYLFGSGEPTNNVQSANQAAHTQNASAPSPPVEKQQSPAPVEKQIPAGIPGSLKNNYHHADDQNCGNFLTAPDLLLAIEGYPSDVNLFCRSHLCVFIFNNCDASNFSQQFHCFHPSQ